MPAPRKTTTNAKAATARTPRTTPAKPSTTAISLDDLLTQDEELSGAPSAPETTEQPEVAPDQEPQQDSLEDEEIARLQAELETANRARLAPARGDRPLAESELTPKQREIRALRDQVAQAKAKAFENAEDEYDDSEEVVVTIHFVADGFTAQGRTWLTGQTLSFGRDSYNQTKDRLGNSWLDLDEGEQYKKYGKIFFRRGEWGGARYEDEVSREDARRGTAAPLVVI